jgi:hypothetical protein
MAASWDMVDTRFQLAIRLVTYTAQPLKATVNRFSQAAQGGRKIALGRVASELAMILDGIDVSKLQRVPRYERSVRNRG